MSKTIKQIRLMNFQIHKSLTLDLQDGMVALVGQSSSGKTAVLRAIRFCLYNQMPGNSVAAMISHGETHCEVEITFDDGLKVLRVRDSKTKDNYYIVTTQDGEVRLDTPGTGPVKDVVSAHGMRLVSFLTNKDSLNYASQHDAPFFINASPQERMKAVGILSNTEVTDAGIKIAAANIRENKKVAADLRKTLSEKNARLKEIGPLKARQKKLEKAKELIHSITTLEENQTNIALIDQSLRTIETKEASLDKILAQETSQQEAETSIQNIISLLEKIAQLAGIQENLARIQNEINECEKVLSDAPSEAQIADIMETITSLAGATVQVLEVEKFRDTFARINTNLERTDRIIGLSDSATDAELMLTNLDIAVSVIKLLRDTQGAFNEANLAIENNEKLLSKVEQEYHQVVDHLVDAFSTLGVCPLCESKLSPATGAKIAEEYKI